MESIMDSVIIKYHTFSYIIKYHRIKYLVGRYFAGAGRKDYFQVRTVIKNRVVFVSIVTVRGRVKLGKNMISRWGEFCG